MRITLMVGLAVWAGLAAGCGGGESAPIDCAWLAGDNCWKTTASMAASCLPPQTEQGVLSADNRTCGYASGVTVAFNSPLQLPLPDDPVWNFTVTGADDQACLQFQKVSSGAFTLVVGGQTFEEGLSSAGLTATCPDGSRYVLPLDKVDDIFDCPGTFGGLPGQSWSSSTSGASFSLIGTSATSSQPLSVFSCYKASS
jgi:hypothetical protein